MFFQIKKMNNLVKLTNAPSFDYDWSKIEDSGNRFVASTAVNEYKKSFADLRSKAEQIIKDDNLAKSRCVYQLKLSLPHGQFQDVCLKALGIGDRTASALASTGKLLIDGTYTDDVLAMVQVMEPQACNKFLLIDDESKSAYVSAFHESGRAPSQRDFVNRSKEDNIPRPKRSIAPAKVSTRASSSTERRLKESGVSAQECLSWLISLATDNSPSDSTKELIAELYAVAFEEVQA